MKILVTGHRGYIGSHLADPATMMGCDLKDGQDFREIRGQYFDVVVHLAAKVSVLESFEKPKEYFDVNAAAVGKFLAENEIKRFIFASTGGAMYGNRVLAKEEEASFKYCLSPYAQSKFLAEEVIRHAHSNYVILRLGNVFGGDMSVRGEANVHAHFSQDDPIVVYGGEQTRDFVHVSFVCAVIRKAMRGNMTGTFNVGTGRETKIMDIAQAFARERNVPIEVRPARFGEVERISLDISKSECLMSA